MSKKIKLTNYEMSKILREDSTISQSIYLDLYKWGLDNLLEKSKGHIHHGSTTIDHENLIFPHGYGTNGWIYSHFGKKGKVEGKYFLFRVSVDAKISFSVFWNTKNYSDKNKKPFNNLDFQKNFIEKFTKAGFNFKDRESPFQKRDVYFDLEILNSKSNFKNFINGWDWVFSEIEKQFK